MLQELINSQIFGDTGGHVSLPAGTIEVDRTLRIARPLDLLVVVRWRLPNAIRADVEPSVPEVHL